jgi:microcystin-dependent protein
MLIPVTLVNPAGASVPTGVMLEWPTDTPPSGYLLCDGTVYNVSAYPTLGALLVALTQYGGNGTTTFGVPDRRGRVGVGKGTNTDVDTIGENDGSAIADRRVKHKHTVVQPTIGITDPGHTHDAVTNRFSGAGSTTTSTPGVNLSSTDLGTNSAGLDTKTTGITASASAGTVGPQSNVPDDGPAYITLNYIIKT